MAVRSEILTAFEKELMKIEIQKIANTRNKIPAFK